MLAVTAPAAGAPTVQIVIATALAAGVSAALLWLVSRHRSGRSAALRRAAGPAARLLGMPPWAAVPTVVAGAGLATGAFGVFWDIAIHIGDGRDAGPLANPSHYLILAALYACFAGGVLSIVLHEGTATPARRPLRLPGGLSAPVGGVLLFGCGAFALAGFPLDDVWHRMFGQDVTLWGPTHLVMINGAILSVPALTVLGLEARRAAAAAAGEAGTPRRGLVARATDVLLPASLLFAVSFWATEFDWGLPQYRMVWQPLLLAAAAGFALVSGRIVLGRGGALITVAAFLITRGLTHLGVDALGETAPALPVFVVEALAVEAAFLAAARLGRLRAGALAGLLCGTAGFAAEYAWSHVAMPLPWTPGLLAEGVPTAVAAGVAGGVLGAMLGGALTGHLAPRGTRRLAGALAACALVVAGANALWTAAPGGVRATVALEPADGGAASRDGVRAAVVTARFDPPAAARGAHWLTATAWQGGGLAVRRMREVAPGTWRSDGAVPVGGAWKTSLRLQRGRTLAAVALHLPRDPAVPTAGVRRPARFTATLVPDVAVMQTERRDYVPGWLWTPAALLMLAVCALFVLGIAAGIARAAEAEPAPRTPRRRRRARRAALSRA
jgi:hypothetical protein